MKLAKVRFDSDEVCESALKGLGSRMRITVLADDVQPNDLVVSHKGFIYFTETGKGQVTIVDSKGTCPLPVSVK